VAILQKLVSSSDKLGPFFPARRFWRSRNAFGDDFFFFFFNYSENRDQRTFVSASSLVDEFASVGDVSGKCVSFRPF